jgi:hypothetical protein
MPLDSVTGLMVSKRKQLFTSVHRTFVMGSVVSVAVFFLPELPKKIPK